MLEAIKQIPCKFFGTAAGCRKGEACSFAHWQTCLVEGNASNSEQPSPVSTSIPLVGGVDAGKCNASLSAVEPAPFGKDLWILDSGTIFDMCPSDTLGFLPKEAILVVSFLQLAVHFQTTQLPLA